MIQGFRVFHRYLAFGILVSINHGIREYEDFEGFEGFEGFKGFKGSKGSKNLECYY